MQQLPRAERVLQLEEERDVRHLRVQALVVQIILLTPATDERGISRKRRTSESTHRELAGGSRHGGRRLIL